MQKELQEKSKAINMLEEQFEELKKRKPLSDDEEDVTDIVQSQFLPAHLINEMMGGYDNKKEKSKNAKVEEKKSEAPSMNQSIDEDELEEMYSARLKFD